MLIKQVVIGLGLIQIYNLKLEGKMINLDFTTDNPRWGKSGIEFTDLFEYAKTLGFLSNIRHYDGHGENITEFDNSISIHIEGNHVDGAWAKECRIHYYKDKEMLNYHLHNLCEVSSAGRGDAITCRINSNKYINHLIAEYDFLVYDAGYSRNVFPNERERIISRFEQQLIGETTERKISAINNFNIGWEL